MKLLLLIILFCGINVMPSRPAKPKRTSVHQAPARNAASFEMVPASLLFQF